MLLLPLFVSSMKIQAPPSPSSDSMPKTAAPANNRIEIKIGKIDLEVHQATAAGKTMQPQPRARQNASSVTAGNNLSRYYLRGGFG